jgi:hypothetical protein
MDRRTVIKNLALVVGGAVLLPSCLKKDGTSYVQLKHINIDEDQQRLITEIAETIIPKTNTPGAKDLNLPAFVLKMIDDCYNKKDQQAFLAGLVEFNTQVKTKYNSAFADLDIKDREALLTNIENSAKPKTGTSAPARRFKAQKAAGTSPLNAFYWTIKQQTIFAYTTSQYFMTKQIVYELIPGRYIVHYPVKKLKLA